MPPVAAVVVATLLCVCVCANVYLTLSNYSGNHKKLDRGSKFSRQFLMIDLPVVSLSRIRYLMFLINIKGNYSCMV